MKTILFCLQDEVGGGFEMQESLSGVVSGLNIWNKQLDQTQIENMAQCKGKNVLIETTNNS